MGKSGPTGGGVGTNQYKRRGVSQERMTPAPCPPAPSEIRTLPIMTRCTLAVQSQDPLILNQLAHDRRSYLVREGVARNPHTDPDTLQQLTTDPTRSVQTTALSNPSCPPDPLIQAATQRPAECWWAIVSNPNCPPSALAILARGNPPIVWVPSICKHPNTPTETLVDLAKHDDNGYQSILACQSIRTPEISQILARSSSVRVRRTLAANPTCDPDSLVRLVKSKDPLIRQNIIDNPSLPDHIKAVMTLAR